MLSLYELKKILNPKQDSTPEDDFRIIQSWAEYDEKSSKPPEERNLKYLCYELEVMNPDTGEITHFYKAIKFARVIRLPANAKQSTAFMDMQEQILAGVHERNYNMITIIANVIKPVALGLLYLYGIQGVAESLEKAKEKAYYDFKGFVGMLQGTFRVLEIKCVEAQETEWLREKMYNMDYMTVVRGIPKANKAGEDAGNRGMGGSNINPDSQGTLEEMITGMADYEYVIEVLSTPVYLDTLTGWQRQSQKEMTAWYSQLQGTKSLSMNLSIPMMYMANASQSQGWSKAYTDANSVSYAHGESFSQSEGQSVGESLSRSFGQSIGHSQGQSLTNSVSHGLSTSHGVSFGESFGHNTGISAGMGTSANHGTNVGAGVNSSQGMNASEGLNASHGTNTSQGINSSHGTNQSMSMNESQGYSEGTNVSQSHGYSQSYTSSNGTSKGTSNGTSGTMTSGTSSSMGLGPSIGYSKSYQWLDQGVKDLLELMEFQNERIKKALRGQGAFYTYVYIGCPSLDALSTAQAVAKSTWQNEYAMVEPIQVLDLSETEQKHLLYHFAAFSADVTREDVFGVQQYKYCTVLLPEEYTAYTHLPRVSEGGVFSIVQDIPKFSVPSMLKGEIYMGTILNPERWTFENGYRTQFDYRIAEETLLHGFFTGASRSGKTVAAIRFIAELSKVRRKKTGKRLRIVAMDPKQDWRTLARFVEPERFKFYSMGNVNFRPIKLNPWKIPKGVYPQIWIDGVIDIYCRAYGLLERGKQMIADVVFELYEEAGVMKAIDKEDWKETVPELSKQVNFAAIYKRMEKKKDDLDSPGKGRAGNDTRDAYARLLDRLNCFDRKYSIESRLYGTSDGLGIDDLIGDDDVTVLESKGLENTFKNFIFGVITSGFYKFALAHEGGFLAEDQYETVLVIEEANEVLTGNDCAGTGGGQTFGMSGQSEFEQILDQSAGYGLFIMAITQKIADMPSSIIANSGLVFAGRLKRTDDINVVVRTVGREERIDDRDLVKWFPRSPTGWFVCQTSRTFDFKDAEPILVQISRLNINPPSNLELDEILIQKEAEQKLKSA